MSINYVDDAVGPPDNLLCRALDQRTTAAVPAQVGKFKVVETPSRHISAVTFLRDFGTFNHLAQFCLNCGLCMAPIASEGILVYSRNELCSADKIITGLISHV
jgi:hypothetical protein